MALFPSSPLPLPGTRHSAHTEPAIQPTSDCSRVEPFLLRPYHASTEQRRQGRRQTTITKRISLLRVFSCDGNSLVARLGLRLLPWLYHRWQFYRDFTADTILRALHSLNLLRHPRCIFLPGFPEFDRSRTRSQPLTHSLLLPVDCEGISLLKWHGLPLSYFCWLASSLCRQPHSHPRHTIPHTRCSNMSEQRLHRFVDNSDSTLKCLVRR